MCRLVYGEPAGQWLAAGIGHTPGAKPHYAASVGVMRRVHGGQGVGRGYELARMERPVRRSSTQLSACYIVGVVLNRAAWLRRPARDQDGMGKGGSGCRARAQPRAEPKKGKKLLLLLLLQTAPEGRPDTRGVTDFIAAIVRRLPSCCNKQQQGKRES